MKHFTKDFLATEMIGETRAITPEGFLICYDAAIARIGEMDYAEIEVPGIEGKDGVIVVNRTPEEVFRADTIASFEGKPVTIDHPSEPVTPANWKRLAVGFARNVRQGGEGRTHLLVADLLITDEIAISLVNAGLVELSCG